MRLPLIVTLQYLGTPMHHKKARHGCLIKTNGIEVIKNEVKKKHQIYPEYLQVQREGLVGKVSIALVLKSMALAMEIMIVWRNII